MKEALIRMALLITPLDPNDAVLVLITWGLI
jgi:hypothetical protein